MCRYLSYAPPAHKCCTRPFFRWVQSEGRSQDASSCPKNALGPIGIPLKRAPQAPGNKPRPSEEGQNLEGRLPEARDKSSEETHLTKSVQHTTWPAEM